jgi:predicted GTPase
MNGLRTLNLEGHVGFDSLPDQVILYFSRRALVVNFHCSLGHSVQMTIPQDQTVNSLFAFQLVNQSVQSGFTFNIMCIGETGLGKSTLMDSLFNTSFDSSSSNHKEPSVRLTSQTYELEESNVKLKLTICDTVGYGDQVILALIHCLIILY